LAGKDRLCAADIRKKKCHRHAVIIIVDNGKN
jgi:hypothetical protein